MGEISLECAIVGQAGTFDVTIDDEKKVSVLKKAIKAEKTVGFKDIDADTLQLFLAKGANDWLDVAGATAVAVDKTSGTPVMIDEHGNQQGFVHMDPTLFIKNPKHFGVNFQPGEGQVHVLVVVSHSPATEATAVTSSTPQANIMLTVPAGKRRKTDDTVPTLLDELGAIIALGQELNPETDLAVGKLLDIPKTVLRTSLNNGLYIRQEYWDLYKMIMHKLKANKSLRRILVIGSPGIGKSVFGVFLFLVFVTEKKDIAFRTLDDSSVYYFNWNGANGYDVSNTPLAGKTYECIALPDPL